MATTALVVLAVGSLAVLVLASGLFVTIGAQQLHSPLAIAHDGPRAGRAAPQLETRAIDGSAIRVPAESRQIVLFADHSLMDFPELLELLTADRADRPNVVVLGSAERTSTALLEGLDLRVPAAVVPHSVYHRYRVRVMPYAVLIDTAGRVVASRLVNTPFQLQHLAQVGLDSAPERTAGSAGVKLTPRMHPK